MAGSTPLPIRYVVLHKPGPKWKYGIDFREQPGVNEHVQHYLKLHEQGKLELGGPFLVPDLGGMMVATKDVTQAELDAFAAADPSVKSGLLVYEIRPWMMVMEREN
jgi:uncharacterized protein YciI